MRTTSARPRLRCWKRYALAILALLDEGEAIRQESDHPLFPHRPVQTCTGILGPFGVHPSAICGEVGFELIFHTADNPGEQGSVTPTLHQTQCGASVLSGLTSQGPNGETSAKHLRHEAETLR